MNKKEKAIERAEDKLAKALPAPKRKAFAKVQAAERRLEKKEPRDK